MKEEPDAPMATPDVAMMPTGSNLAPQQYRALLLKRFSENKDNVLGFLGTYKDRLEGELQFLSTSVHPHQRAISLRMHAASRLLQCAPRQLSRFWPSHNSQKIWQRRWPRRGGG